MIAFQIGVLPRPVDESKPIRHRRPRIVIIGAGMAGLSTARELINLYDGYPDTTLPEIILLEGRKRVGGRVTSFPVQIDVDELEDMDELEDDDNDAARPLPRVELGAQIITGFKKGNPLRVVVRRQLQLDVHYLKNAASSCILYDQNGDPVNHDLDAQSEKIYNHILDQASNTVIQEGRFQALPSRPTPSYFDSHRHLDIHEHVSLGRMFEFILHKHLKHNHLDSERLKLIHWHLANAEFSTASTADDISLYHWDQDDGFAFGMLNLYICLLF